MVLFPSSAPQVHKKCRKNIQNEKTKYFCDLFPFVIFKRQILTLHVYRADVTFLIPIEEISVSKGSNKYNFNIYREFVILCCEINA